MRCSQLLHVPQRPMGWSRDRGGASYSDDSSQSFEHIALRSAVKELLELARGQFFCWRSADIAGIAGGFEGEVASCRERPVSEVRGMHDGGTKQLHDQKACGPNRGAETGSISV